MTGCVCSYCGLGKLRSHFALAFSLALSSFHSSLAAAAAAALELLLYQLRKLSAIERGAGSGEKQRRYNVDERRLARSGNVVGDKGCAQSDGVCAQAELKYESGASSSAFARRGFSSRPSLSTSRINDTKAPGTTTSPNPSTENG